MDGWIDTKQNANGSANFTVFFHTDTLTFSCRDATFAVYPVYDTNCFRHFFAH